MKFHGILTTNARELLFIYSRHTQYIVVWNKQNCQYTYRYRDNVSFGKRYSHPDLSNVISDFGSVVSKIGRY